ncbi:radical SAM protein [candidate division KSB1 bacterium]
MKPFRPGFIYIDEKSLNDSITERVLERFSSVPYEVISGTTHLPDQLKRREESTVTSGKRTLYLRHNQGKFVERCPGTANSHICCNYHVANIAVNCHLDCTYCFLQSYLTERAITVNTNVQDFLAEIDEMTALHQGKELRIGTGELADSLALDELTGFSTYLVPFFAERRNVLLELKTKGNFVDNLLTMDPKGNSVIAWSLNTPDIIKAEEFKCSILEQRLEAAVKCRDAGYKLAFHFDPLIIHDNYEIKYREVVEMLFDYVGAGSIRWISLGVLRFTSSGKAAIEARFPNSKIVYGEMIAGADGKMRYLQPVRVDIYRKMVSWIRSRDETPFIYLCMESPAVWNRVFGVNHAAREAVALF